MKVSEHFTREEFACKCGCGFAAVDVELLSVLEEAREFFNKPITINSGCRCKEHNEKVGGEDNSMHTKGIAVDVVVKDVAEAVVASYFEHKYPDKYGVGRYPGRTHIDVRSTKARWTSR